MFLFRPDPVISKTPGNGGIQNRGSPRLLHPQGILVIGYIGAVHVRIVAHDTPGAPQFGKADCAWQFNGIRENQTGIGRRIHKGIVIGIHGGSPVPSDRTFQKPEALIIKIAISNFSVYYLGSSFYAQTSPKIAKISC